MLKLRYLFENFELAKTALRHWHHDVDRLDEALGWFRISSNAVYPFFRDGRLCFLRLAPAEEKQERNVRGEVEFIAYLVSCGYPAMRPLPADSGENVLVLDTAWGRWYATAFARVPGRPVEDSDWGEGVMVAYGRALGRLHALAAAFVPVTRKWDHGEALDWAEGVLAEYDAPPFAREEAEDLCRALSRLPRDADSYGLVHYDFEPDNVFFDEQTGSCSAIDFDDGMYHWYALDIEQALAEVEDALDGERLARAEAAFLRGYAAERSLPGDLAEMRPLMRRFCDLFAYARLLRCLSDHFEDEPSWVTELREKLGRRRRALEDGMRRPG